MRLKAGLAPPHWEHTPGETWDSGYAPTAFFLDWVNTKFGSGTVRKLNESMKDSYQETTWTTLTGSSVESLFEQYKKTFHSD